MSEPSPATRIQDADPDGQRAWLQARFEALGLPEELEPAQVVNAPGAWLDKLRAHQAENEGVALLAFWCRLQLGEPEAGIELAHWLDTHGGEALGHWLMGDWLTRHGQSEAGLQSLLTAWQLVPGEEGYFAAMLAALIAMIRLTAEAAGRPPETLLEAALLPLLPQITQQPRLLRSLWQTCLSAGYAPTPRLSREVARHCLHTMQPELGRELLSALIAQSPERADAPLSRALMLPTVYADRAQIQHWRDRCRDELQAACAALAGPEGQRHLARDIEGLNLPGFLLAYQSLDNREIYDLLGDFWHQSLNGLCPLPAPAPAAQGPLTIGVVSAHFYAHAVSQTFLELIAELHILGARVILFDLGRAGRSPDAVSQRLGRISSQHLRLPESHAAAATAILQAGCDLLLYPEIGMDLHTYWLAARRLAPLQIALSGHPESTGLPTIDAFVSSKGREPADAQAHYRERLLCLERFPGIFSAPEIPPPASRAELGLPEELADCRFYVCPMTPFKIHPDNDALFAGILAADPQARLLLFEFGRPELCAALGERLQHHLGPLYERVLFLPFLKPQAFHQLLRASEICLDTRGFGGGNTPRQVLGLGVPMLSWPGEFMKQRVMVELCELLEVPELLVSSGEAFVARAVEIATKQAMRADISARLLAHRDRVFGRREGAYELLAWCEAASGKNRKGSQ